MPGFEPKRTLTAWTNQIFSKNGKGANCTIPVA